MSITNDSDNIIIIIVSVHANFGYLGQESSIFSMKAQFGKPESTCAA